MKQKKEINKDILIGELVESYPNLASILVEKYDFHCIGCMAAGMETLEQGARVHGMNQKEIDKMIKYLKTQVKVDLK
jgi:hybrid cluster-associated redox disulfide protein